MYYIYMLRCEDNSIYTGIAKDLEHRLNEHFTKDEKCAKYTKSLFVCSFLAFITTSLLDFYVNVCYTKQ